MFFSKLLLLILFSGVAEGAQTLRVFDRQYSTPASAPSCRLLHHRELERQKVMRELETLAGKTLNGKERALVFSNTLLANKFFMPRDTWIDEVVQGELKVELSNEAVAEIARVGLGNMFLQIVAPGFVWQSLTSQLPEGVTVVNDGDALKVNFHTYLNSFCEPTSEEKVTWVPTEDLLNFPNSKIVMEAALALLKKF